MKINNNGNRYHTLISSSRVCKVVFTKIDQEVSRNYVVILSDPKSHFLQNLFHFIFGSCCVASFK